MARAMAWELPRFPGRLKVAEYPEVVRARLARYGIAAVFEAGDPTLAPKVGLRQGLLPLLGCLGGAVGFVLVIFFVLRALARALNWCGCR